MSAPVITFFNNKGGVGKTSLLYHLAWMLAELGHRVVAADLDPQANLTSAFLDEQQVEKLWPDTGPRSTVWGVIKPFQEGDGPIGDAPLMRIADGLALLPGDLALSSFENDLARAWPESADKVVRAYRVMSTFWTILRNASNQHDADVVLVDVGPSLGAINRAVLVATDHVVIPLAPDLFSLQGLRNLGPTLRDWRTGWLRRLDDKPADLGVLPGGQMDPAGYVLLQHGVRLDRPVKAYDRWISQIPGEFHRSILDDEAGGLVVADDPACLGLLKNYRSLVPLAQEARKPIFALTHADGAYGGHLKAARDSFGDFEQLATRVVEAAGIQPTSG